MNVTMLYSITTTRKRRGKRRWRAGSDAIVRLLARASRTIAS